MEDMFLTARLQQAHAQYAFLLCAGQRSPTLALLALQWQLPHTKRNPAITPGGGRVGHRCGWLRRYSVGGRQPGCDSATSIVRHLFTYPLTPSHPPTHSFTPFSSPFDTVWSPSTPLTQTCRHQTCIPLGCSSTRPSRADLRSKASPFRSRNCSARFLCTASCSGSLLDPLPFFRGTPFVLPFSRTYVCMGRGAEGSRWF